MTHATRWTAERGATPSTVRLEREISELRDEITRRPPALVTLDTLDRLAAAVESVAQALTPKPTATPEPVAYAVVWETADGEKVIDKRPTTLDVATAELADYRARWPEMTHYLVALVPVVTP